MPRKKGSLNKKNHYKLYFQNKILYFKNAKSLAKHLNVKVKFIYDRHKYKYKQKKTKNKNFKIIKLW